MYQRARSLVLSAVEEQLTAKNTAAAPDPGNGTRHALGPIGSHGRLDDFQWLAQSRYFEQVETSTDCAPVSFNPTAAMVHTYAAGC